MRAAPRACVHRAWFHQPVERHFEFISWAMTPRNPSRDVPILRAPHHRRRRRGPPTANLSSGGPRCRKCALPVRPAPHPWSADRSARFLAGAFVSSERSRLPEAAAIASTAARNAASFAFDGLLKPLTFRTNCSEAARISSSVTGGSKLKSSLIFLHMLVILDVLELNDVTDVYDVTR